MQPTYSGDRRGLFRNCLVIDLWNYLGELKLHTLDPAIDRTLRRLFKKKKNREAVMACQEERRTLRDYTSPSLIRTTSCIKKPATQADNFKLKIGFIRMVQNDYQFGGLPNDDLYDHIANFLEIYDTQQYSGVPAEKVRLMIFSFSLRDKVRIWFKSLPKESITTWDQMAKKFLTKYFPPAKSAKFQGDITTFTQFDTESIYDAWKRYKGLIRKVPNHALPDWLEIQFFYNRLQLKTKMMVNAAVSRALMQR